MTDEYIHSFIHQGSDNKKNEKEQKQGDQES